MTTKLENIEIIRLEHLPVDDFQPLLEESLEAGFEFLDRLRAEYVNGINRFQEPGDALFGVYCDRRLIAIGGLNRDPYLEESDVARVRHVYVLSAWRGQGIGKTLLQSIVEEAKEHFRVLTLRTFGEQADSFYRAIGFQNELAIKNATHHLVLTR